MHRWTRRRTDLHTRKQRTTYDLVVIGGGSAGLTIGALGPKLGARVAVVEANRMGGDCTWYGCVPSKALLASGRAAARARDTERYGLPIFEQRGEVDLGRVMDRIAALQQQIYEESDSPDHLRALGCDVLEGRGRFVAPDELLVDGQTVRARTFCIATGSRALVPPIDGLDAVPYLTNETIFTELRELPRRLLVIGGGPVGTELGQALARLGSAVTITELEPRLLPREDPELGELLCEALEADGLRIRTGVTVTRVTAEGGRGCATVDVDGGREEIEFDALLVATGRRPNIEGLGLDAAGVACEETGSIKVDRFLRTTNRRIYACGDVIGRQYSTHAAGYEATTVLRNALFPLRSKANYDLVPAVTFTDPEVASVGLTEEQARATHGSKVRVYRYPFAGTDRAKVDGLTTGMAKLVCVQRLSGNDRVVGAQIIGPAAGELIHEYILAIRHNMGALDVAQVVHAYPTLSQAPQYAAMGAFNRLVERPIVRAGLRTYRRLIRLVPRGR